MEHYCDYAKCSINARKFASALEKRGFCRLGRARRLCINQVPSHYCHRTWPTPSNGGTGPDGEVRPVPALRAAQHVGGPPHAGVDGRRIERVLDGLGAGGPRGSWHLQAAAKWRPHACTTAPFGFDRWGIEPGASGRSRAPGCASAAAHLAVEVAHAGQSPGCAPFPFLYLAERPMGDRISWARGCLCRSCRPVPSRTSAPSRKPIWTERGSRGAPGSHPSEHLDVAIKRIENNISEANKRCVYSIPSWGLDVELEMKMGACHESSECARGARVRLRRSGARPSAAASKALARPEASTAGRLILAGPDPVGSLSPVKVRCLDRHEAGPDPRDRRRSV